MLSGALYYTFVKQMLISSILVKMTLIFWVWEESWWCLKFDTPKWCTAVYWQVSNVVEILGRWKLLTAPCKNLFDGQITLEIKDFKLWVKLRLPFQWIRDLKTSWHFDCWLKTPTEALWMLLRKCVYLEKSKFSDF